jgi:type VI protein secretion system component Hcp
MSLKLALSCLVALVLLGGSGTAVAQSDVFMCVDGIPGGSTDQQFAGCSQISAVSYSVGSQDQPPSGSGRPAARPTCGQFVASKALDTGSIPILLASLLQQSFPEVEFAVRRPGQPPTVVLQLILRDVVIVRVDQSLGGQAPVPVENVVLRPGQVLWRFTPQDPSGAPAAPIEGGFDCTRNSSL